MRLNMMEHGMEMYTSDSFASSVQWEGIEETAFIAFAFSCLFAQQEKLSRVYNLAIMWQNKKIRPMGPVDLRLKRPRASLYT
jgi:hypothetical protein